jgi:hypothetical protein
MGHCEEGIWGIVEGRHQYQSRANEVGLDTS